MPSLDPVVEMPPAIAGLVGLPQTYSRRRSTYLHVITREAHQAGLPAAIADAVAHVESAYNPAALGGVGEVGLMQVRPSTAAMLGYAGTLTGLFDPETNIRYGVAYLARAWQLASGDLCRTLMKYRAGHGEERMTALSIEYCQRARQHLAAIGSPLANGTLPPTSFGSAVNPGATADGRARNGSPDREAQVGTTHSGAPRSNHVEAAFARELSLAQSQARLPYGLRTAQDSKRFWAAHEARMRALNGKLNVAREWRPISRS